MTVDLIKSSTKAYLVALAEMDILSAASLRELFGIYGQKNISARRFRDKLIMKKSFKDYGISTARFIELHCQADVIQASENFGYPFVIKSRYGMGSIGTFKISGDVERDNFLLNNDSSFINGFLAEEFISGQMYCVDGVYKDKVVEVSFVSKISDGLTHLRSEGYYHYLIDQDTAIANSLRETARLAIEALAEGEAVNFTFHCEVFVTSSGELFVCEIASRTAGARIPCTIKHGSGLDLNKVMCRLQCDLPVDLNNKLERLCGAFIIPSTLSIPSDAMMPEEWDWIIEATNFGKDEPSREAKTYSDSSLEVLFFGKNQKEIEDRLDKLRSFLYSIARR